MERLELMAATIFTVTNTNDSGAGSLRIAMNEANMTAGPSEIDFAIPGTGPVTIMVGSTSGGTRLPTTHAPVFINGYSEGNFQRSITNYSGPPLVVIDGTDAPHTNAFDLGPGNSGLGGIASYPNPNSNGSEIAGLDIVNFSYDASALNGGTAITIEGSSTGDKIVGNYIGVGPDGTTKEGNGDVGIFVNSADNVIGGTAAGQGNVVSGNANGGVLVVSTPLGLYPPATNNLIEGNKIGTDATGATAVPNGTGGTGFGVGLGGAINTTVGGTAPGAANVISGNAAPGVLLSSSGLNVIPSEPTSGNVIQGNLIGTAADGVTSLPNTGGGVVINGSRDTNNSVVGNTIAFNTGNGVAIGASATETATGNKVISNSIYSNSLLGIDLGSDGVTHNDASGHTGPNLFQNFPVLSTATTSAAGTTAAGTLTVAASTPANTPYTIQFFASPAADASGYGQGKTYLGTVTATTGAGGVAPINFSSNLSAASAPYISATATDAAGNTSEFSLALKATVATTAPPSVPFVIEPDNMVYTAPLDASGAPTGAAYYLTATGQVNAQSAVRLPGTGNFETLVIGRDNQVRATTILGANTNGYFNTAWGSIGSLTAGTDAAGKPLMFGLGSGTDNQLYEQQFNASGQPLAGKYTKVYSGLYFKQALLTHDASGTPLLFLVDSNNLLDVQKLDAGGNVAGGLITLGGPVVQLAAGHDASGNPEVFAVGSDTGVYAHKFDPSGTPVGNFLPLGGSATAIAAASNANGNPEVFVIGTDNQVYAHKLDATGTPTGGYVAVTPSVTGGVSSIAAGTGSNGSAAVYAVYTSDGQVYAAPFDASGTQSGPFALAAPGKVNSVIYV